MEIKKDRKTKRQIDGKKAERQNGRETKRQKDSRIDRQ
jgi:hypothetical protein